MGTEGFAHGMTPNQLKRISELKKTNKEFKEILIQKELKPYNFYTLQELEQVVVLFYEKYNNQRLHASVCSLPPNIF
jgi:hypothetical protein